MAADILPTLLSFPPEKQVSAKEYDKQAHDFAKHLIKLESGWTKASNKQNILDLLNPAVNTIPYTIALYNQTQTTGKDRAKIEDALNRSVSYFTCFDAVQVRYVDKHWCQLMHWAFEMYPHTGIRDFTPLSTSMLRLDPTGGTFTSSHLRLVRLCMEVQVPSQALPILDKNIYAYPQTPPKNLPEELLCEEQDLSNAFITSKSHFTATLRSEYILEYYLIGANIYIGMRNFSRARLFLEYIILTPTSHHVCSALQTEAYKKWLLVGLLETGKAYPLPRTQDQQVLKSLKAVGKCYESLVENFEKRKWRKFQAEVDAGVAIWNEDGNLRLVQEVGDALLRYRVIDLQRTYAVLPVSRVAKHLSLTPDAALRLLSDMIQQDYLNANISSSTSEPVLHFDPTTAASSNRNDDLEAQTSRIQALTTFIRDADRRLQLSKEYVEYAKRNKRGAAGPEGDLDDQMDLSWDAPIAGLAGDDGDEEDIMA